MGGLRGIGRGGRVLLALAVGGAVFGIAAVVQADIPDGGVIHGCYARFNLHSLRVIDSSKGEHCLSNEVALDWNVAGVTGARGATGPTGPSGIALWADVKSNGTLVHGTATGASRISTGNYDVTFGQSVENCAAVANTGGFNGFDSSTTELAEVGFNTANDVVVNLYKLDNTQADSSFRLIVAC